MTTPPPVVRIPDKAEIEHNLSAGWEMSERVAYVLELLEPARLLSRAVENLERELARKDATIEGMQAELKALHQKLAPLSAGDRAALDARYDMLSKIKRARGRVPEIRQRFNALFDELERELKQ